MVKKNKDKWFRRVRGSYLPVNTQGWLTYIPFLGYCLLIPLVAFQQEASIGFQVFTTLSNWLLATLALTLVAQKKS